MYWCTFFFCLLLDCLDGRRWFCSVRRTGIRFQNPLWILIFYFVRMIFTRFDMTFYIVQLTKPHTTLVRAFRFQIVDYFCRGVVLPNVFRFDSFPTCFQLIAKMVVRLMYNLKRKFITQCVVIQRLHKAFIKIHAGQDGCEANQSSRHSLQKTCPHNVATGSTKTSKQTWIKKKQCKLKLQNCC